jgi:hypothetical protein
MQDYPYSSYYSYYIPNLIIPYYYMGVLSRKRGPTLFWSSAGLDHSQAFGKAVQAFSYFLDPLASLPVRANQEGSSQSLTWAFTKVTHPCVCFSSYLNTYNDVYTYDVIGAGVLGGGLTWGTSKRLNGKQSAPLRRRLRVKTREVPLASFLASLYSCIYKNFIKFNNYFYNYHYNCFIPSLGGYYSFPSLVVSTDPVSEPFKISLAANISSRVLFQPSDALELEAQKFKTATLELYSIGEDAFKLLEQNIPVHSGLYPGISLPESTNSYINCSS